MKLWFARIKRYVRAVQRARLSLVVIPAALAVVQCFSASEPTSDPINGQRRLSLSKSSVTLSDTTIASGASATVTLRVRDSAGADMALSVPVGFSYSGGSSTVRFDEPVDRGGGVYTATVTGIVAGSGGAVGATVNGNAITSTPPRLTVTPGVVSLSQTTIIVSPDEIAPGQSATLTLRARDAAANAHTSGGLVVAFNSTGTATGTISPTTDHANGMYTAMFSSTGGGVTTIGATIGGSSVTSSPPTLRVGVAGPAGPVARVEITPAGAAIAGGSFQFAARAYDAAGREVAGRSAAWGYHDDAVATVDASGRATALASGQSVISATIDGVAGTAVLTVGIPNAPPVTWSRMSSPTSQHLNHVWSGSNVVYAVGNGGTILRYTGQGFTPMPAPTNRTLYGVWGGADGDVWAAGDWQTLLHLENGQWTGPVPIAPPSSLELLHALWGSSWDNIYAVASPGQIRNSRAGNGWGVTQDVDNNTMMAVWGFSRDNVIATGDRGVTLHFNGNSWTQLQNPLNIGANASVKGVWGAAPNDVFAAGFEYVPCDPPPGCWDARGFVIRFNGSTWSRMNIPTLPSLAAIWGTSSTDVYAVGEMGGFRGTILRFDGTSWTAMQGDFPTGLMSVTGTASGEVFAVGLNGVILRGTR